MMYLSHIKMAALRSAERNKHQSVLRITQVDKRVMTRSKSITKKLSI